MSSDLSYPQEWDGLPKRERKKKLRELKRQEEGKKNSFRKVKNVFLFIVAIAVAIGGFKILTKKSPEEDAFEKSVENISLEGKVEEFEIEGAEHVVAGEKVSYNTNPPTSGAHYAQAANWGFYDKELADEQLVHNLEHGGVWISFKDIDEASLEKLKSIAGKNKGSVIVTKRQGNGDPIVVASWGRYMRLTEVNEALIQKYVDTYRNQSPEKLAR